MRKAIYTSEQNKVIERIVEARRNARLTQVEVAQKLGRTQSFISKIESGQRRIDVVLLRELAILYGEKLDYFVG